MEATPINKQRFNLAGIVPIAGQPTDFDFPWHDSLIPIGQNYLAAEKAVFDCAMAGCDTIWLVCPKEMQPLIRYRLGDYVVDPHRYYTSAKFADYPQKKEIPIYYVPVHPKDVDRRNSFAWSIITGAQNAYWVGRKLSRWTTPDKYFVTFPYGLFTPYYMGDHRAKIRSERPFCLAFEGQTFREGLYLSFTFDASDFLVARRKFRKNEVKGHDSEGQRIRKGETYSGRYFTHDYVFQETRADEALVLEVPWYFDVSTWANLKKWLGSNYSLDKPKDFLLSYNEWNPIGVDINEEEE